MSALAAEVPANGAGEGWRVDGIARGGGARDDPNVHSVTLACVL
jgi:hypothetical protein